MVAEHQREVDVVIPLRYCDECRISLEKAICIADIGGVGYGDASVRVGVSTLCFYFLRFFRFLERC